MIYKITVNEPASDEKRPDTPQGAMANSPETASAVFWLHVYLRHVGRAPAATEALVNNGAFIYPRRADQLSSCDLIREIVVDD